MEEKYIREFGNGVKMQMTIETITAGLLVQKTAIQPNGKLSVVFTRRYFFNDKLGYNSHDDLFKLVHKKHSDFLNQAKRIK